MFSICMGLAQGYLALPLFRFWPLVVSLLLQKANVPFRTFWEYVLGFSVLVAHPLLLILFPLLIVRTLLPELLDPGVWLVSSAVGTALYLVFPAIDRPIKALRLTVRRVNVEVRRAEQERHSTQVRIMQQTIGQDGAVKAVISGLPYVPSKGREACRFPCEDFCTMLYEEIFAPGNIGQILTGGSHPAPSAGMGMDGGSTKVKKRVRLGNLPPFDVCFDLPSSILDDEVSVETIDSMKEALANALAAAVGDVKDGGNP